QDRVPKKVLGSASSGTLRSAWAVGCSARAGVMACRPSWLPKPKLICEGARAVPLPCAWRRASFWVESRPSLGAGWTGAWAHAASKTTESKVRERRGEILVKDMAGFRGLVDS